MSSAIPISLTVPKNTKANAFISTEVHSLYPLIIGGRLIFPGGNPGPAGLLYGRIYSREHPIYPFTGDFIAGHTTDDLSFSGYYPMAGPPWLIRLEAYNLDDTWPHTIKALVMVSLK